MHMNNFKLFGLLAVATTVVMAFAAHASATTITSPTNTAYTGEILATAEGHAILKNPVATIECSSRLQITSLTHGSGQTAKGAIESFLWGEKEGVYLGKCTNNWHVTTVSPGSLEIHWVENHVGTVTATGLKQTATHLGITCVYETSATHIGTLTDSHTAGDTPPPANETVESTATIHIKAQIPINGTESSGLCGTGTAEWKGSYIIRTPDRLYINQ
jgi:hypothetical protein